ncbi:hypothetical protein L4C54_10105 [Vibrio lamellibrachiae]|uniref:hypothetical protein n=1 Tax=Vibrio lamellibrachiae TaxID=2910253 RepID=UPI003D14F423
MNLEQQRRASQLAFEKTNDNVVVGNLEPIPLTLEQLKATTSDSPYVVTAYESGLTAVVYHIRIEDRDWTLKCQRAESLVKNIDGQTSFLNEVQRRRDLSTLKVSKPRAFRYIVDTQFASYRDGIILSPWINGDSIERLNRDLFEQVFEAIINIELSGLFEWDFCPGNILCNTDDEIRLFDFGYMYRFDPLTHFNSNGTDTPLFHGIERFETRFFFDYLLKNKQGLSDEQQFELYRLEKTCALEAYQRKLLKLTELGAMPTVIKRHTDMINTWEEALNNDEDLQELRLIESFRSNVLDLLDDVHGQSCTPYTLKKADFILNILVQHFELLSDTNGLFFGDELLGKEQLREKYLALKHRAMEFQLEKAAS